MRFVVVNHRAPWNSFCALCCDAIVDGYVRELGTHLCYCSYKCYKGHCEVAILAIEHHTRRVS